MAATTILNRSDTEVPAIREKREATCWWYSRISAAAVARMFTTVRARSTNAGPMTQASSPARTLEAGFSMKVVVAAPAFLSTMPVDWAGKNPLPIMHVDFEELSLAASASAEVDHRSGGKLHVVGRRLTVKMNRVTTDFGNTRFRPRREFAQTFGHGSIPKLLAKSLGVLGGECESVGSPQGRRPAPATMVRPTSRGWPTSSVRQGWPA